jgi:hypothetical protein
MARQPQATAMKPEALTIKQLQLKLEALQGGIAYFRDKAQETVRWMEELKPIPEVFNQMQHNLDIYQRAEQRLCRQAAIVCRQMAHEYDAKGQNHYSGNFAKPMLPAVIKLQELNKKNEQKDGYSLGDVLLLDKWEKDLEANGFSKDEIKILSPSYYGR